MKLEEIKEAVRVGKTVYWKTPSFKVQLTLLPNNEEQWLIIFNPNNNGRGFSAVGLTHGDGVTLNGEPEHYFIVAETKEECLQRLYKYLKTQFHDVETAKAFMKKWNREWNQELRGFDPGPNDMNGLTQRAMSYHVCYVLEGKATSVELYFSC